MIINVGIISQFVGMGAAGGAQFFLFIENRGKSYIVLLLQLLAIQFCLTVDQNLVSHQVGKATGRRIAKVSADELICDAGVSVEHMLDEVASKVQLLVNSEKVVLAMVSICGLGWCCALAYCT